MSLVFQEAFLFADTVAGNVTLHDPERAATPAVPAPASEAAARSDGVGSALAAAAADRFVSELPQGTETVLGERGVTLSGGQRQRVALARALVRSPQLLMLDDATSAVDPVVEAGILANLWHNSGATTLIVAHRLSTIALADRVAYLDAGRIAAVGTHQQLLERDDYRWLVTAYERASAADSQAPRRDDSQQATSREQSVSLQ